ncbi:MAG: lamin tail domain-containing protein, partial [Patescibacteria group bacterium]
MKKTFLFCFFACLPACMIFCVFIPARSVFATGQDIVISEIMVGQEGAPDNEYIKLSNNSDADIALDGFSLKKKTQSGSESALVSASKFKGAIKARGFFV